MQPPAEKPIRFIVAHLAKQMKVSERSIYHARKITREAPELVPLIEAGSMSLRHALKLVAEGPAARASFLRILHACSLDPEEP